MAQHSDPLEALRQVAEFLDLLADQARATSQAIHDAIPDQVIPPNGPTCGVCGGPRRPYQNCDVCGPDLSAAPDR